MWKGVGTLSRCLLVKCHPWCRFTEATKNAFPAKPEKTSNLSHRIAQPQKTEKHRTFRYTWIYLSSCDPTLYGAWKFFSPFGSCSAYTIVSQHYFVVSILYQLKTELQYPWRRGGACRHHNNFLSWWQIKCLCYNTVIRHINGNSMRRSVYET